MTNTTESFDMHAMARRNVLVLTIAACVTMAAAPIAVSTGGLAGDYLLGEDKSLATLPVTAFNLGVGLGAIPAALIMRRIGRKYGFMFGSLLSGLAGALAGLSLIIDSFWGFTLSVLIVGLSYAFVVQYRFAAADYGDEEFKSKAISYVLLGGIGAAVIGPQVVIYTVESFSPYMFAGNYFAMCGLAAVGLMILSFLQRAPNASNLEEQDAKTGRPLRQIMAQPRFIAATVCTICNAALMSFVMTAAPLAMVACGFSTGDAALGIQWHVIAMYGPSFITGSLMNRFGKERVVAAGMIIMILCAIVALLGIELWNFWLALILLGVGWNFGFIGGTALVTTTYRPEEKNRVQGVFDFLVYGSSAFASLMSGVVFNALGWGTVAVIIFPVIAFAFAMLIWLAFSNKRAVPAV